MSIKDTIPKKYRLSAFQQLLLLLTVNVLLAFIIIFYAAQIPFFKNAEISFYGLISTIKRQILSIDDKPKKSEYLFVDTSYTNQLNTTADGIGNEAIVDRKILTKSLNNLASEENYTLVVLDIIFNTSTVEDAKMLDAIKNIGDKIILPKNEAGIYNTSLVNYWAEPYHTNGYLIQYPLIDKDKITYPTAIYKRLFPTTDVQYFKFLPFVKVGDSIYPKSLIIEHRIRPEHIDFFSYPRPFYNVVTLQELSELKTLTRLSNKIIVIGNFSESGNDVHQASIPFTYGSLAILNTYLMLKHKDSSITISWVLAIGILLLNFFHKACIRDIPKFAEFNSSFLYSGYKVWVIKKLNLKRIFTQLSDYGCIRKIKKIMLYYRIQIPSFVKSLGSLTVIATTSYVLFNFQIHFFLISLIVPFEVFTLKTLNLLVKRKT